MPKGFNDIEKQLIRQKLVAAGKELFGRYGFKKASIDAAVRMANISKGAFYHFFTSKELYFMEVLESIEKEMRSSLATVTGDKSLTPEMRFKTYIQKSFEFMAENPLMAKIKRQDLELLLANLPTEKFQEHLQADLRFMSDFIGRLRTDATGSREIPEQAFSGFFQFLFYIFLHKDDMDDAAYRQGMELLLDMASHYFFKR